MFSNHIRIRHLTEARRREIMVGIVNKAWDAGVLPKPGAQGGHSPFMTF